MVISTSVWLYAIALIFILIGAVLLYRHTKAVNARIKLEQEKEIEWEDDIDSKTGNIRAHAIYDPSEGRPRFIPLKRRKTLTDK